MSIGTVHSFGNQGSIENLEGESHLRCQIKQRLREMRPEGHGLLLREQRDGRVHVCGEEAGTLPSVEK